MSFEMLIMITLITMSLYALYLEKQIREARKNLKSVAQTFYDLLIVLDAQNIINLKEGEGDDK